MELHILCPHCNDELEYECGEESFDVDARKVVINGYCFGCDISYDIVCEVTPHHIVEYNNQGDPVEEYSIMQHEHTSNS